MLLFNWPWAIDGFHFQTPQAFLFLLVIPAIAAAYVWMQMQRRKYAVRYASVSLLRQAVGAGPGVRRHVPAVLYLCALTAMVLALARPAGIVENAFATGTVILAIDVSGSMWAEDVSPNRMEATKEAAKRFVQKQPRGVEIGIVSFSDFGILTQEPSRDKSDVIQAIERLQPKSGTNISGGMQAALDAIYSAWDQQRPGASQQSPAAPSPVPTPSSGSASLEPPPATIVLVSDGQHNSPQAPPPLAVAREAVEAGIQVYTIGIGTPQGAYLRIQGRNVFTRLDEETLRAIAEMTGGEYLSAQDDDELTRVYEGLATDTQTEEEERDLTYYLTGIGLIFSLIAGGFSLAWFNRLP